MQNIVRVLLIATCFVWAPRSIAAAGVAWDTDRAVLAGSGCAKDVDSFVASTESDLSIVLTGFVLDLNGFSGQVLAARKTCLLRIPARIPTGYYVSKLTQKINYQIEKTPRSRASISASSSFFGFSVAPISVNFRYGAASFGDPETASRTDYFNLSNTQWVVGWCSRTRAQNGLFQYTLAASAQKDSAHEDLYASSEGLELKSGVDFELKKCP